MKEANIKRKMKKVESVLYLSLWMVIFLMPVFFSLSDYSYSSRRIYLEWIRILPFFLIFCFHNYLLFPKFFDSKRKWYFVSVALVIIILGLAGDQAGRYFNETIRQIRPPGIRPQFQMQPMPEMKLHQQWYIIVANTLIISVLVVGFNAAIKLALKWQNEEHKNKELEKQKLQTELAFLRNQVSPHFFMNTLNNIHALVDINEADAKESIIKLSKLMRYMLYDSESGQALLSKEVDFIRNYIDLMKLRFTENIQISVSFPEIIPEVKIPPLLFVSLIENAFKHGVSYQTESFIKLVLKVDESWIWFSVRNSIHTNVNEKGGIGLKNLQKRLELIYGNNFGFEFGNKEGTFEATMKLPANENQVYRNR